MAKQVLTADILSTLVGKTISWVAPGHSSNGNYQGIAKIESVELAKRNPIQAKIIEGDELNYAFNDDFHPGYISFSDSDRFVMFEILA